VHVQPLFTFFKIKSSKADVNEKKKTPKRRPTKREPDSTSKNGESPAGDVKFGATSEWVIL
jgi:hypothetical protein